MKLKHLIMLIIIFILSACTDLVYEKSAIVVNIEMSQNSDYKYKIKVHSIGFSDPILYTNTNYTVGDTIKFR